MAPSLKINSWNLRAMIASGIAVIAMLMAIQEGRAQNPVLLPPLSGPMARYFHDNPAAWDHFLSQLPRRPAGPPQATPQPISPPFGGTWAAVPTTGLPPSAGLCNPLLLTDGTVIVHNCVTTDWYKLTPDYTGSYVTGT